MLAALSPASVNFEETLSTLIYANQVKAIKNKAKVNESAQDKLIRELQAENEKLKNLAEEKLKKLREQEGQNNAETRVHMMNINEDALLTGRVKHFFKDGNNVCGKKNAESNPDINIGGIGVTANHCQIAHVEETGQLTLTPHEDHENSKTYLNGDLVTEPKELEHGD